MAMLLPGFMPSGQPTGNESSDRLVLRQSKPSLWATLGGLVLTTASISGIVRHGVGALAWFGAIFFGAATIFLLIGRYWRPGTLALTTEGFSTVGIVRTTSHRWRDVSNFRVASLGYVYLARKVIFLCLPTSPVSPGMTRALGAYGDMKPQSLAGLMNSWRSRLS